MAKILIIEDDADFSASIKALIESFLKDVLVELAGTGKEGLRVAASWIPDVILLDLGLPDIEGFEVTRRLTSSEATSSIPIIILTGIGMDSTVKIKALELGADAFLSKPFEPGELAAQIRAMLRIREAEGRLRQENVSLKLLNEKLGHEMEYRMEVEHELQRHRGELESLVNERTAELNLLQEINNAVNTGEPLDTVLKMITGGVKQLFGYDVCDIYSYHPETNELEMLAHSMDSRAVRWVEKLTGVKIQGHRFYVEEGFFFHDVLHSPDALITYDMVKGFKEFVKSKYIKSLSPLIVSYLGYKSAMRSRLVAGDKIIGIIGVARRGDIHQEDTKSLSRFAAQLSIAFHKTQTEDALRREYAFRRAVEDSVTSGIIMVSPQGEISYVNPALCRMVGFERDELLGRKPPFPFWLPEDSNRIQRMLTDTLMHKKLPENMELKFRRKDGKLVDVMIRPTLMKDETGKPVGTLASIIDITERKALEKQVLVASEEERQSIGHDLHDGVGQYLTGTAFMAKALEDKLRKKQMPEAEDASVVVGNLNETIDKVRRLAKGVAPVQVSSESFCVLFREIADYAEDVLGLNCSFNCDKEITLNDRAILGQMYMITREALINAAKHSGADRVSITLSGDGNHVSVSVEDNGSGFKEHGSDDPAAGMGMSIMRYRANMIGATLEINTGNSGGTVVSCSYRKGGPLNE